LLSLYYRETNAGNIYIALVMPKEQRAFLGQMPKPNAYLATSSESVINVKEQITNLHLQGLKPSQIIEKVWEMKPSKSDFYKSKVDIVLQVLENPNNPEAL